MLILKIQKGSNYKLKKIGSLDVGKSFSNTLDVIVSLSYAHVLSLFLKKNHDSQPCLSLQLHISKIYYKNKFMLVFCCISKAQSFGIVF